MFFAIDAAASSFTRTANTDQSSERAERINLERVDFYENLAKLTP